MLNTDYKALSKKRRIIQSITWFLVLITIFGGLRYPLLGFVVPVVMIMGIIGSFFKGRYVCGWLCPRGAFFDRVLSRISITKNIPSFFRNSIFRWILLIILMSFMVYQISFNPSDINHWGKVFVRICIITTIIAVVLGIFIHPRAWCSFCPMGTIQSFIGGGKTPLYMDDDCKKCRTCEKACPINLKIVGNIKDGKLDSKDCLKCPECQLACPKKILHF